jgi:hypothetical protein
MKKIIARMEADWLEPYYKFGGNIPVVIKSNHPNYRKGTRLDWGFVQVALGESYIVEIKPLMTPEKERGEK